MVDQMGDDGAEKKVRAILGNSKFTYKGKRYKIVINEKPSPETKTDFYILAERLQSKKKITKEFKISYKTTKYAFLENKLTSKRSEEIYGKNWKTIIKKQIMQKNSFEVNQCWLKKSPCTSLKEDFRDFPVVNFKKGRGYGVVLGWRIEIEDLHAPKVGRRRLSGKIKENIIDQILWGKGCSTEMRDAKIGKEIIKKSGIPDYILIKNPECIKTANDVFKNIQDIRKHAESHNKVRNAFFTQNLTWSKTEGWKTESDTRSFAVWIKWRAVNGKLSGRPVLDKPFTKTAGNIQDEFWTALRKLEFRKFRASGALGKLRKRLAPETKFSVG